LYGHFGILLENQKEYFENIKPKFYVWLKEKKKHGLQNILPSKIIFWLHFQNMILIKKLYKKRS
jgi:hypothetical protein